MTPDELAARTRALIASDRLTAPTRAALAARVAWRAGRPTVLSERQMAVLRAVAARLMPLGALADRVDPAGRFEAALARGGGDGWRYAAMPPDVDAVAAGLDALDAQGFLEASDAERDRMIEAIPGGIADWPVSSTLWFEEVLGQLVQLTYAHPLMQVAIGFDGMADADGWPMGHAQA